MAKVFDRREMRQAALEWRAAVNEGDYVRARCCLHEAILYREFPVEEVEIKERERARARRAKRGF